LAIHGGWLVSILLTGYLTLRLTAPQRPTVPLHRITNENIEAIRVGMTKGEFESIFGVPPGNYTSTNADKVVVEIGCIREPSPIKDLQGGFTIWLGDAGGVYARFDQDSTCIVIGRLSDPVQSRSESLLDKLRRWLGVQ
jgi:hypothetical protein